MHGLPASTMPRGYANKALPPLRLNDAKHALLHESCIALLDILGRRMKISDLQGSYRLAHCLKWIMFLCLGHHHTKTTGSARSFVMRNFG
jgi:hypothetical protein